jgi:sec-independent protein translocase protein TatA
MRTLAFIQGVGPLEIGVILGLLLLFFGAKRLPELAKGIGESFKELRKGAKELENDDE